MRFSVQAAYHPGRRRWHLENQALASRAGPAGLSADTVADSPGGHRPVRLAADTDGQYPSRVRAFVMSPAFDVIVFGASGFTGRLVAEYLNARHGVGGEILCEVW